jgi:hypothetical protein
LLGLLAPSFVAYSGHERRPSESDRGQRFLAQTGQIDEILDPLGQKHSRLLGAYPGDGLEAVESTLLKHHHDLATFRGINLPEVCFCLAQPIRQEVAVGFDRKEPGP